jgi:hypothetical protein
MVQNQMDESATINEVLARPFLIIDKHLTVPGTPLITNLEETLTAQTFLQTLSLPSAILNDPNKITKLQYFKYFTADIRIRIETNAQPYMSGKFWIFYEPYPNLNLPSKSLAHLGRASLTSYPGIEYDLNQMSNGEIIIPFVSYERAFDMENILDYCQLYITQLTPIRDVTTETNLRMRIYGWFENIKVFGATAQSNLSESFINSQIQEYNNKLKSIKAKIQINSRAEQKAGPISSIASGVSTISGALKNVPLIGSIAGTVGWVSDIVGNVASIFGYSRPTSTSELCKISNIPGHGYTYATGIDSAVSLSTRADNELGSQNNVFQTNVDEMDIDYVARNPGVIRVFTYSTTSDNNAWLQYIPCSVFPDNHSAGGIFGVESPFNRTYNPTCGEYAALAFNLWRGTICFKISISKTPFHNGRLLISFDPSNVTSDTPLTRLGKSYSTILDLSENSSVIVKIPFISKFDYLNTNDPSTTLNIDFYSFGTLSIGPLAPLLGPATVSDSVDVVVWKWFEDLELAQPTANSTFVFSPLLDTVENVNSEIQINLMNRDEENVVVFNNPKIDTSLIHAQDCIGEKVVNLRQMLRMHRYTGYVLTGSAISPFSNKTNSTQTATQVCYNRDYVNFFSQIYRFYRGGFSYKFRTTAGTYFESDLRQFLKLNSSQSAIHKLTPTHITSPTLNPFHEVRTPFYSQTHRRVICDEYAFREQLDYSFPVVRIATDSSEAIDEYLAGNDDLSYGWLVGPPNLVVSTTI